MNAAQRDRAEHPDDEALLAMIKSMFEAADPMPAGLVERIKFSVALADLESELARLTAGQTDPADWSEPREHAGEMALARGTTEESRTITFDSSSLTIMIRIDSNADGTVRVDGWLAPPLSCQVEMTLTDGSVTVDADEEGRFAFPSVPRGTARLVVRRAERGSVEGTQEAFGPRAVVTPALVLLLLRP